MFEFKGNTTNNVTIGNDSYRLEREMFYGSYRVAILKNGEECISENTSNDSFTSIVDTNNNIDDQIIQWANYMLDKIDYCDVCGKAEIIIPLESYDLESFPDLSNKKVCQGCRAARYGAKINQLEQEIQEEEEQEDAIKKQEGYTFKHSVWIHPARGDDFNIVIYSNKNSINENKLMKEYNARKIEHSVSKL